MITQRKIFAIVVVAAALALSGCGDPGGKVSYSGTIEVQNGTFVMDGEVGEGYISGPGQYRDVRLHLATENGTVYRTVTLGDIDVETSVAIRDDRIPTYMVVDSPDIWGEENSHISTSYYERTVIDDRGTRAYVGVGIWNQSQLPIALPDRNSSA